VSSIRDNLETVRERIARAAARAGRSLESVRLLAVTKTQPPERIREAWEAGQRHFGENMVQEFERKRPHLDLPAAQWRLIGHLQSNKARRAAELFDAVETVDTLRLANRLNAYRREAGRAMPVLVEVKLSPEPTKAGCSEDDLPELVRAVALLPYLELRGLMTIPPYTDDPEDARPYFRRLREWGERLGLPELSMGMTHDFEAAIEEGATTVRVGTAIFGERPRP
jgi:PLP dependent protein